MREFKTKRDANLWSQAISSLLSFVLDKRVQRGNIYSISFYRPSELTVNMCHVMCVECVKMCTRVQRARRTTRSAPRTTANQTDS